MRVAEGTEDDPSEFEWPMEEADFVILFVPPPDTVAKIAKTFDAALGVARAKVDVGMRAGALADCCLCAIVCGCLCA